MSPQNPFALPQRPATTCTFHSPNAPCAAAVTSVAGAPLCQVHVDRLTRMEACGGIPDGVRRNAS